MRTPLFFLSSLLLLSGCSVAPTCIEPDIVYYPQEKLLNDLPPTYPPLSPEEKKSDWGKELTIGKAFAKELDLYRALTAFKRAEILTLDQNGPSSRVEEAEFDQFLSYSVGLRYQDVINTFQQSCLGKLSPASPAFTTTVTLLTEAYIREDENEKADALIKLLGTTDEEMAEKLGLYRAFINADFELLEEDDKASSFLACYQSEKLSVSKAKFLNAVLPGAGYWYVGQKRTALTSFIINALFIGATYELFRHHQYAWGIITLSLETGWYFGGINGAGLAAKYYNESLYNNTAKQTMLNEGLFPLLMIQTGF